jgi:hydrogenase-4 membrane subunit HyfE
MMNSGEQSDTLSQTTKAALAVLAAIAWFCFGVFQLRTRGMSLAEAFGRVSEENQIVLYVWLGVSVPLLAFAIAAVVKVFKPVPPK